ncbi:hypothetical protein [Pectobacterium odoriferum]|uniref:hypothetical protein n=1 Tax=Pectobacterium odoriferum TaxID=78398 RepID=UPI00052AC974|nr:hypothetical protein [Pectobacterium odoriferum]AIU88338.1 hypothetical protein BCS7_09450 [Pectobacterium odoriferum]POE20485.1 hypothetical protein BV918_02095 [Pectobacterium odoriferum]POE37205.1 hypothetical protein BV922_02090 [Pectobacterium odoriferum]
MLILLLAAFSFSVNAIASNYIGKNIITGSGNRFASGMVIAGAESVGKDRVKIYFIDYSHDLVTNEMKPDFFKIGLINHEETILNCKKKTYSSYSFGEIKNLDNVSLSYHELGAPHKWGDYDFKDDGHLGVEFKKDQDSLSDLFGYMCDSALN